MTTTLPSSSFVKKLCSTIDQGLQAGKGDAKSPGAMCVQQAVNYCKGYTEDPGDQPECVHRTVRKFLIALNDASWSNGSVRAAGLKKLAIAQLGTKDWTTAQSIEFATKLAMHAVNTVPLALRAALKLNPFLEYKAALEAHAAQCEKATVLLEGKIYAAYAARAAAYAARAAAYAARAAAYAAADAAYAAAYAADAAADAAAYAADARDQLLIDTANFAVSVLVEMKTPGSEFINLAD